MTKENMKKYLTDPRELILGMDSYCCRRWGKRLIGDRFFIKLKFKIVMGYRINLKNPQTFNEKIRWLILYDRDPLYTKMADKHLVREYVAEVLGREEAEKYLVPLLGVWERFEDIDFDQLPEQFVLKCNHDCGSIVTCEDKNGFNRAAAGIKLSQALKSDYYLPYRERHMKGIQPLIIAEKHLGVNIMDYKFFVFGGVVKMIKVDFDRFIEHKRNIYNEKWEYQDFSHSVPTDRNRHIPKPRNFDKMMELATTLSGAKPFLRVDFYEIEDKLYLGELALAPTAGLRPFSPREQDYTAGSWLTLPPKRNEKSR